MTKARKSKVRLSPEVRRALSELGRIGGLKGGAKGGKTTASRRTPEERSAAMRHAVNVRWAKVRVAKAKHTKKSLPKP